MTKSRVFKVQRFRFIDFLGRNNVMLFLTGIMIIGMLSGCLIFGGGDSISDFASDWFFTFLNIRRKTGFFNVLISVLWSYLPFQLACYFCGTSVVGSVITPFVVALKGFFLGLLTSFVFSEYGLLGIAFNGLIVIPASIVCAVAMLLSAKEALAFSFALFKLSLPTGETHQFYNDFKKYSFRNLTYLLILFVASFIDAAISCAAIKLFEF